MTYEKAIEIINKNKHLIGKLRGESIIDEIIAVPVDSTMCDNFVRLYCEEYNAHEAIQLFKNIDLKVLIVFDKVLLISQNMFIYEDIENLKDEFEIYF